MGIQIVLRFEDRQLLCCSICGDWFPQVAASFVSSTVSQDLNFLLSSSFFALKKPSSFNTSSVSSTKKDFFEYYKIVIYT